MKRIGLLLLVLVIAAAVIIALALRHKAITPAAGVATLLPADTALFVHVPDLEANRAAWQRTDLYQLYHEPAVQDFLSKPRTQLQQRVTLGGAWSDAVALRIRDAFVATSTLDTLRLTAGFEFRCGEKEAREIIERWKERWVGQGAQRSSVSHGKYQLEVLSVPRLTIATVIVDHRCFAATTIADLNALLDRVDHHGRENHLNADKTFRAAMKQMPQDYAALVYLQPRMLAQKLAAMRAQSGRTLPQGEQTLIEKIESISHAMIFDGAKLRDISFVAMPRQQDAKLARETLATAPADTLLYLALITNLRQQLATGFANRAFTEAGVTRQDWNAAFGDEMSVLVDWPETSRIPGATATLAIRDLSRARTITRALASAAGWQDSTRDNTEYFTAPASGLAVMRLTAAVSDKRLVVGLDPASVEREISPVPGSNTLASSAGFREASRLVPEPQQMFAWLDLVGLYSRLDSTVRPLLQISAALMPESSDRLDVSKLPPAQIVTKHLSGVIASQSYVDGGYRSESVGPITLSQAFVLGVSGYVGSQLFFKHADLPAALRIAPLPAVSPSPTP